MFDYLTKTSIINLKEFIVESINYLGWESDLSIRPPRFFKYCLEVSMNTNQWERLSWKTVYSMILANNNTKWVSSQLFGCGRATRKGTSSPPSVYHWINTSSTCRSHGPSVDPLLSIVCNKVTEEWGEIFEELAKEGGSFWNNVDVSMLFSHHLNINLAFLPELSHFDLERNSYKQIIKIRLLRLSKF